jgi:hypothetical protein
MVASPTRMAWLLLRNRGCILLDNQFWIFHSPPRPSLNYPSAPPPLPSHRSSSRRHGTPLSQGVSWHIPTRGEISLVSPPLGTLPPLTDDYERALQSPYLNKEELRALPNEPWFQLEAKKYDTWRRGLRKNNSKAKDKRRYALDPWFCWEAGRELCRERFLQPMVKHSGTNKVWSF